MWTIYALVDPRTSQIRYIGQTQNHPEIRLDGHLHKKDENREKREWLDALKRLSLKPFVVILDYASSQNDALELEREWIKLGIKAEWPLLNSSNTHTSAPRRPRKVGKPRKVVPLSAETISRWRPVVAAWFAANPQALTGPAQGISDLARAMCRDAEGNDANYANYKGRAHKLFHEFRAAVRLPNGDKIGTDITGGA